MDIKSKIKAFHLLDIVMICGLPGCGKSHFARNYFIDKERERINRSEIRRLMYEMTHFGTGWSEDKFNDNDEILVKHVERKIFEHFLQNHRKVLIDNTSVTTASRKNYVDFALGHKKTIGAIFLNVPVQICMTRNKQRESSAPDIVISKLFAKIVEPSTKEGFREVLTINGY